MKGYNGYSGSSAAWTATGTTANVIIYTDYANGKPKPKPKEETAEQWLRNRVKEICNYVNLQDVKT